MSWLKKAFGHFKKICIHKWWVFYYSFYFGVPWRGFIHDWSKFYPVEFLESVKFYNGMESPIPIAKKAQGYSLAWQHHKGHNEHHYEYWVDNLDSHGTTIPMPFECVMEMIADWFGAGRAYKGKGFTYLDECNWWDWKKSTNPKMNVHTIELVDYIFDNIRFFEGFDWVRQSDNLTRLKNRYRMMIDGTLPSLTTNRQQK